MRAGVVIDRFVVCMYSAEIQESHVDMLQATNTPELLPMPDWLTVPYLPPNLGTIVGILYSALYVLLEPVAGTALVPLIMGGTALANYLTSHHNPNATYIALGVHIFSWIAQFIGHGKYEGRAPALLDNIVQAVFLAPLFVWIELLFMFGYRPELKNRLDKAVEIEINKWKQSKAKANGKAN